MKYTIILIGVALSLTGCNLFDRADPPRPDDDPPEDMSFADMSDETPDLDPQRDMARDMNPTDMQTEDLSDLGDMPNEDMPDMSVDLSDMSVDMASVCGDSKLEGGELCDDGNAADGDGCSSMCEIADGWVCPTVGQLCLRVTGIGQSNMTRIAAPTLPKEGMLTDSINCPSPAFAIAVQGRVDTRSGIGSTSVQCARMDVDMSGAITISNASSLNDFLDLPDHTNFESVVCPADAFLTGLVVYHKPRVSEPGEVTGIQPRCSKLAVQNGKMTRVNSSAPRMTYGQTNDKSYTIECGAEEVVVGLLADIHNPREGNYLNRLSLRCNSPTLLVK